MPAQEEYSHQPGRHGLSSQTYIGARKTKGTQFQVESEMWHAGNARLMGHQRAQCQGWDLRPGASLTDPRSTQQARGCLHVRLSGSLSHTDSSPLVAPELGQSLKNVPAWAGPCVGTSVAFTTAAIVGLTAGDSGCDLARGGPRGIVFHTPPRSQPCGRLGSGHPSTLPAPRRCCSQRGTFPAHRELVGPPAAH